jgi:clan AA aspartic protease (TIGR02281 family)
VSDEPADIVDTSHVDEALANARRADDNARRRALIWTIAKSAFWGGIGLGALCIGASFLLQPKVIETTKIVEVPKVIETTKVVEVPKIIEAPKLVEASPKVDPAPKPPIMAPPQLKPPESHPWDALDDKHYEGVITDVVANHVCFDHNLNYCARVVQTDSAGRALLDANGNMIENYTWDYGPMRKWIGYSAYSAARPEDPQHLRDFWVANNGTLILFEMEPRQRPGANEPGDAVALHATNGGLTLLVDVGIGGGAYSFVLDTGATGMTVTKRLAALLATEGHATDGPQAVITLADGSTRVTPTVIIDYVRVGTHIIHNVSAQVTPDSAEMLLGMETLNRIGKFTVDAASHKLTFG